MDPRRNTSDVTPCRAGTLYYAGRCFSRPAKGQNVSGLAAAFSATDAKRMNRFRRGERMSEDTWAVSRLGAPFSPINFPLDMGLGERNGISPEPPTPSFVQRFHCALARNPGRMRPGLHGLFPASAHHSPPTNFPLDMGLGERNGISPERPTPSFDRRFHCALARNPGRMRPGLHGLFPASAHHSPRSTSPWIWDGSERNGISHERPTALLRPAVSLRAGAQPRTNASGATRSDAGATHRSWGSSVTRAAGGRAGSGIGESERPRRGLAHSRRDSIVRTTSPRQTTSVPDSPAISAGSTRLISTLRAGL